MLHRVMDRQIALEALGRELIASGYRFVTPTPETHRRVNARPANRFARDLRDVFGWNRPFPPELLSPRVAELVKAASAYRVVETGEAALWKATVRYSTLDGKLFLHSGYPTDSESSVFFGPDTYRFVAFLKRELPKGKRFGRILDLGAGSGAGGLSIEGQGQVVVLADSNEAALEMARINASMNPGRGAKIEFAVSDLLRGVGGRFDLIIANPPFLVDDGERAYRHGGDELGAGLSLRMIEDSLPRLDEGGLLLMYTASAIVGGRDRLRERIEGMGAGAGWTLRYAEIDPDIFGEEMDRPPYREAGVERLAAVGLALERASSRG